jgi:hypothetical protein
MSEALSLRKVIKQTSTKRSSIKKLGDDDDDDDDEDKMMAATGQVNHRGCSLA